MKKILFLGTLLVFVISSQSNGTITYSGPLNITVDLSNSAAFDFDGAGNEWNQFVIRIRDITSGSQTYRTLFFKGIGYTMVFENPQGISNILVNGRDALNFGFADPLPPLPQWRASYTSYLTAVDLSTQAISGNFNPAMPSGYIGLLGLHGPGLSGSGGPIYDLYAWLHISNITDFGLPTMQATIDGWAFSDQNNVPITIGAIPAPGAFLLAGFGAATVAYLRKRRTI